MYKSKWDRYFLVFISLCIILISAVFLVPQSIAIAAGATLSPLDHIIFFSLLVICNMLIIWPMLSIRYEFLDDYLLVKGGPFRSKIRYEDITKVEASYFSAADTLVGYRIMTARDGVEIYYKTAMMGSIRISPSNKEKFIEELKTRARHAHFVRK